MGKIISKCEALSPTDDNEYNRLVNQHEVLVDKLINERTKYSHSEYVSILHSVHLDKVLKLVIPQIHFHYVVDKVVDDRILESESEEPFSGYQRNSDPDEWPDDYESLVAISKEFKVFKLKSEEQFRRLRHENCYLKEKCSIESEAFSDEIAGLKAVIFHLSETNSNLEQKIVKEDKENGNATDYDSITDAKKMLPAVQNKKMSLHYFHSATSSMETRDLWMSVKLYGKSQRKKKKKKKKKFRNEKNKWKETIHKFDETHDRKTPSMNKYSGSSSMKCKYENIKRNLDTPAE